MKTISLKPASGGRLMTDVSSANVGFANYAIKRDWRRVLDGEIRAEGHIKFAPSAEVSAEEQASPPGVDGQITVIAEARLASGRICIVVGTQTQLWAYFGLTDATYVEGDDDGLYVSAGYFDDTPGSWLLIGSGFSATGSRWEATPVGSWLVLNNGADLPVTYRVGESSVVPIHELRENGVASVGTIAEINGILACMDIRQIPPASHATIMTPIAAAVDAAQAGATKATVLGKINSGVAGVAGNTLQSTGAYFNIGMNGRTVRMANGLRRTITYVSPTACTVSGAAVLVEPDQPFYLLSSTDSRVEPAAATLFPGSDILSETLSPAVGPLAIGNEWTGGPIYKTCPEPLRVYKLTLGNATSFDYYDADDNYQTLLASGYFMVGLSVLVSISGPFLALWTGKVELVTQAAAGLKLFWDDGNFATIRHIAPDGRFVMTSDRAIPLGPLSIENPKAYGRYTGVVERRHSRMLWSMPNLPRRFAASIPCTVDPASNTVQLDYPVKSLVAGMDVFIVGAGAGGGNLTATITVASPQAIALADAAVTEAAALIQAAVNSAVAAESSALTVRENTAATLLAAQAALLTAKAASDADVEDADLAAATANASAAVDSARSANDAAVIAYDAAVVATQTARDAVAPLDATLVAADAEASIAGLFEDLEGNGSGITKALKLGSYLAIYKSSGSIFMGRYTGSVAAPFVFDEIKLPNEACLPERHRFTLIALNDNIHIYAGDSEFLQFDTTSRTPKIFEPFRLCKSLFFGAAGDDKFACNNAVLKEIMFCTPSSATADKALCFDYIYQTARTTSAAWTAGASVVRPESSEYWFVGGTSAGALMRQGSQSVWNRDGANYDSVLQSGLDDFGIPHQEKLINSYVLIPTSNSPNTPVAVMIRGGVNPSQGADIQGATIASPNTKNLIKPTAIRYYLGDRLTISGKDNAFQLQERLLTVIPHASQSFGRRGNGT